MAVLGRAKTLLQRRLARLRKMLLCNKISPGDAVKNGTGFLSGHLRNSGKRQMRDAPAAAGGGVFQALGAAAGHWYQWTLDPDQIRMTYRYNFRT
ncbi:MULTISPECIES: hypothetical protein [Stenotrophomonas]|uniref:hypothetical protein n=1 Tax=Stenotrophomonas TaxID=40323 RepID=UPI0012E331BC|nr:MULTISPECIES: hypothetical protein [Stenotrophomonas]